MQIDMKVMELLSSRMCHDLVSPVGAINNGVELIEEIGGSMAAEANELIAKSAQIAARRLRCFRLAYGRAGSESGLAVADVRQVAEHYLESGKSKLVWPTSTPLVNYAEQRGGLKVLLNLIMLGEEMLAYGGMIEIGSTQGEPVVTITVTGRNAQIPADLIAATKHELEIDEITSKSVHAYMTARLMEYYGFTIEATDEDGDSVKLTVRRNAGAETEAL